MTFNNVLKHLWWYFEFLFVEEKYRPRCLDCRTPMYFYGRLCDRCKRQGNSALHLIQS